MILKNWPARQKIKFSLSFICERAPINDKIIFRLQIGSVEWAGKILKIEE
jgi:hypothetical protein